MKLNVHRVAWGNAGEPGSAVSDSEATGEDFIFVAFSLSARIGDCYEPNSHVGRSLLVDVFSEPFFFPVSSFIMRLKKCRGDGGNGCRIE